MRIDGTASTRVVAAFGPRSEVTRAHGARMPAMDAARIWWLSHAAHARGWHRVAKLLRAVNMLLFNCDLAQDADIQPDIHLWHRGLGIVIGPDVRIERNVSIAHQVTIAGKFDGRGVMVIEEGVAIGAGAKIIGRKGYPITLGRGCRIGANAVVSFDVPAGAAVRGPKATIYESPELDLTSAAPRADESLEGR